MTTSSVLGISEDSGINTKFYSVEFGGIMTQKQEFIASKIFFMYSLASMTWSIATGLVQNLKMNA